MMSANPLWFSFYRTKGRVTRRTVALPHGRCYLTTFWASYQSPPSPWPGFPTGYQTIIRLIMAAFRLQISCNRMNRRVMRRLVSLPPWCCCLAALWASFQPSPSPWPGFPIGYQTEISSGHSRNSSAVLLQMDEKEGDMVNCRPSSLALLLDYIISKFPVASKPLA